MISEFQLLSYLIKRLYAAHKNVRKYILGVDLSVHINKIKVVKLSVCGCSFIRIYENADMFLPVNRKLLKKNTSIKCKVI